jgi:hypothetical protein
MFKEKALFTGKLTVTVFGPDGKIKRREPNWWQKLFGLPGNLMISVNHNIITNQGDALIADALANTPARTKVDNTNGYITVGTGWTGTSPKTNEAVNTPTGSPKGMEATYPKLKGTWGNTDDNVTQYRCLFTAGDLNASGIDEAGLGNNSVEASGDNLAYAQITPSVNVTSVDTLQIDWEITALGS